MTLPKFGWRGGLVALLPLMNASAMAAEWYQIEVIAIRYPAGDSGSWAAAEVLPDFTTATRLVPGSEEAEPDVLTPVGYRQLPESALKLAGAYQLLARDGALEPLFHAGWYQPAEGSRAVYLSTVSAAALPLPDAVTPAAEKPLLEGTVKLALGAAPFRLDSTFIVQTAQTPIVLTETRRLKLDELQYLDHPLVGFLVQVTALATTGDTEGGITPATDEAGALPD